MLTKQKAITMLSMQDKMNTIINANWKDAGYNWMLAILVETVEGMEHHGWKWWKKQEIDYPQLRMELVDIWHFMLSHMLVENQRYATYVPGTHNDESLAMTIIHPASVGAQNFDIPYNDNWYDAEQPLIDDLQLMAGMAAFGDYSLQLFSNIMNKACLSWDELYSTYVAKNVLNQFRQANGYKIGSYIKDWTAVKLTHSQVDGRALEDNDHLHDIMLTVNPEEQDYAGTLMSHLGERYKSVVSNITKIDINRDKTCLNPF